MKWKIFFYIYVHNQKKAKLWINVLISQNLLEFHILCSVINKTSVIHKTSQYILGLFDRLS